MLHWYFTKTVTLPLWWSPFVYFFCSLVATILVRKIQQARGKIETKYYLRSLRMRFPDAEDITLITVQTSDVEAMTKIKEQLRDEHRKRVRNRT